MTVDDAAEDAVDAELLAQIAARDEKAFEAFYDRHSPRMYGLCLRILGRPTDAQAVLSDVFYEIWQSAGRFNPIRGSARTYVTTLTRSRAIDRLRADSARSANEKQFRADQGLARNAPANSDPAATMINRESFEQVQRALSDLTDAQRETLELAYFGGLTHREIAAHLHLPLGTVKTNIRTALARLRDEITPLDTEKNL
jgi:RNA polymerase sigma-70 factor (ECF subfamily)